MINAQNYFDNITPIVSKLPEWAKLMHQTAVDLKAADIDPFTELDADDNEMMQNLLTEANTIAMASESKPEPKPTTKPKLKKGDDVEVIKYQWHMEVAEDPIFDSDQGEWIYMLENIKDSFSKGNAGTYAESELYKLDFENNAQAKKGAHKRTKPKAGVKKAVTKAKAISNKQKAISKPTPIKPAASSKKPAAKKPAKPAASSKKPAAKQPSAAQIAARKKFAQMAKDKAKSKPAAKKAAAKKVSTKKAVTKKVAVKKAAAKKPEAAVVRNIKSVEIQHITRYVNLDGKNKSAKAVLNLAKEVKSSIAAKEYIQHTSVLEEIHSKLTKAYNAITDAGVDTVNFEIDKAFKAKLQAILKNVKVRVQTNVLAGVQNTDIKKVFENYRHKGINSFCYDFAEFMYSKDELGDWFDSDENEDLDQYDKIEIVSKALDMNDFDSEFRDSNDVTMEFMENVFSDGEFQGYELKEFLEYKGLAGTNTKKKSLNESNHNSKIKNQQSLSGVTSATDMLKQNYKTIDLGPYKKYFGEVAHNFDMMLHGEPGAGKTYFLLKLANWYANNLGNVLFISDEEFGTVTLQNKIAETKSNSPNLYFSKGLKGVDVSKFDLVILDSINSIGLTLEQYIALRAQNPDLGVIAIMQKNKDGSYKGGKDWEHEFEIAGELIFNDKNQRCIKTYKNRYGVLATQKI